MNLTMIAVIVIAAVLALWPQIVAVAKKFKLPKADDHVDYPTYGEAMIALAVVRERLVDTDCLADDAHNAIEVITHALVEGSSQ